MHALRSIGIATATGAAAFLTAADPPPAPAPLTPLGWLGGPAAIGALEHHELWTRGSYVLERDRENSNDSFETYEADFGAAGPLTTPSSDRDWHLAYEAGYRWREFVDIDDPDRDLWASRWYGGLQLDARIDDSWGAIAHARLLGGEGHAGDLDIAVEGAAAARIAFGKDHLVAGLAYRGLAADELSEKMVVPVIAWHSLRFGAVEVVPGFPRSAVYWAIDTDTHLVARWAVLRNIDVGLHKRLTGDLALVVEAAWRERAWAGWGASERLYTAGGTAAVLGDYQRDFWHIQAGPYVELPETWDVGEDRDDAVEVAEFGSGFGLLITGAAAF